MGCPDPKKEATKAVRAQAQKQGYHDFEIKIFSPKETLDPEGWWYARALRPDGSIIAQEEFRPI